MPSIFDHKYPYTNFEELNLDWFLHEFKHATDGWDQAKAEAETATANANIAAASANSGAASAATAAAAANSAASNAANKAALAESAASVADSAAQAANSAASAAESATSSANSAAAAANSAASDATSAAAAANAAAAAAASAVGVLYIPATISGTTVTCSATDADIITALLANKAVVVRVGTDPDLEYFYLAKSETLPGPGAPYAFTFINKDGDTLICSVLSGWSYSPFENIIEITAVGGGYSSSKTYSEIVDLIDSGNIVYAVYAGATYALMSKTANAIVFGQSNLAGGGSYARITITSSNSVAYSYGSTILANAVTEITESGGVYSSSMTFVQIKAAFDAGRVLFAKFGSSIISLNHYNENDYFRFTLLIPDDGYYLEISIDSNNTVTYVSNI